MHSLTDIYLDLEELVIAGLLEKVERPDGEIGYMLTESGHQAADTALMGYSCPHCGSRLHETGHVTEHFDGTCDVEYGCDCGYREIRLEDSEEPPFETDYE